jgi:signal transduction histidine kinase
MAASEQDIAELERSVVKAELNYRELPDDATESKLWAAFSNDWDAYRKIARQVIALSATNHKAEGNALYLTTSRTTYAAASDALDLLTERTVNSAKQASDRADAIFHEARVLIVVAILITGFMTFILMRHITRSISEPTLDLAARMRSLAANHTSVEIPGVERNDEIGEMARAVVVFRNNAVELAHSQRGLAQQASMLAEKLEHEQRLTDMQRNFVSMASHEFRTPLTVIDGQAQRLIKMKGQIPDEELIDRASKMRAAVLRMTNLIDSLLNSSQLFDDKDGLYYHPAEINLAALLHEVCQMYREITPGAEIIENLRQMPPSIFGDPKLLYQAFSNLLSNAVKYSPNGRLIRVEAKTQAKQLLITVQDQGIGIPAQDLARLFERYHRGSNVKGIVGTGIGLYLVKVVVSLHGGDVLVESTEREGSRFIVKLPMA